MAKRPGLRSTDPFASSAFWSIMQAGADECGANVILVDVGPNLGAINRSALISTDKVVVPLGADLFSLQGLRNLGPTLSRWHRDWGKRLENWPAPSFPLPKGKMETLGYIVQQHGVRLTRPVKAMTSGSTGCRRSPECSWTGNQVHFRKRRPRTKTVWPPSSTTAAWCRWRREHRKPIFHLTAADGAIGGHMSAGLDAARDQTTRRTYRTKSRVRSDEG